MAGTRAPSLSKAKLCVFRRPFSADPGGSALGGITWSKKPPCSSKTIDCTLLGQRPDVLIASHSCLTSASPLRTSPAGCIELPLRKSFFAPYVGSMKINLSVNVLPPSRESRVSIPPSRPGTLCRHVSCLAATVTSSTIRLNVEPRTGPVEVAVDGGIELSEGAVEKGCYMRWLGRYAEPWRKTRARLRPLARRSAYTIR